MAIGWLVPIFLSSLASLLLAGAILLKRSRGPVEKALVAVLVTTAWIQAGHVLEILDPTRTLMWKQLAMAGEIMFPVILYKVGASFVVEHHPDNISESRWRFQALWILGLLGSSVLAGEPPQDPSQTFTARVSPASEIILFKTNLPS